MTLLFSVGLNKIRSAYVGMNSSLATKPLSKSDLDQVKQIVHALYAWHNKIPNNAYVNLGEKGESGSSKHKVVGELIGKGAYGSVYSLCITNARTNTKHKICLVVKTQSDNAEFKTEVRVLTLLQNRKDLAFKPVIYGSLHIPKSERAFMGTGIILLPRLDGSLLNIPAIGVKDVVGLISQQIYTLHYIHTATKIKHCDSHLGNWLYRKEKAGKVRLHKPLHDYHTFPSAYTVYLYDPGLSHPVDGKQVRRECVSVSYDYFRLFSSHAGWLRVKGLSKEAYDLIKSLGQYILALNGIEEPADRDWDNRFDSSIKSDIIARGLLTKIALHGLKPISLSTPRQWKPFSASSSVATSTRIITSTPTPSSSIASPVPVPITPKLKAKAKTKTKSKPKSKSKSKLKSKSKTK